MHVIPPWPLFAILFRGKAVIVVNPRAWAISRTCILDVTGLSKHLPGFDPACLIILIQQWHIGNGNDTIARSLSRAMPSEKSCHESRRISDNNAQMFAEIGHLIYSIWFAQEKTKIIVSSCIEQCSGLTGPNSICKYFCIYRTKFNFVKFLMLKKGKREK